MAKGRSIRRGKGRPDHSGGSSSSGRSSRSSKKRTSYRTDAEERAAGGSVTRRVTGGGGDAASHGGGGSSSSGRSSRSSIPGQPDRPGEAEAKMRAAGVSAADIQKAARTARATSAVANERRKAYEQMMITATQHPAAPYMMLTPTISRETASEITRRSGARSRAMSALLAIKPSIERALEPVTSRISSVTTPWYAAQEKRLGFGGRKEAEELNELVEEYNRAISGVDRRSVSEIKEIGHKIDVAQRKYEEAKGTPPVPILTEAEKKKTMAYKSHQLAQQMRGWELPYVDVPGGKYVREGAASITEFLGSTPTTLRYGVPAIAKKPSLIVPLATVSAYEFGKAVYHEPVQTGVTLAMTWGLFKGAGKVSKPIRPTILKTPGYTGVGARGFKGPIPIVGIRSAISKGRGVTTVQRGLQVGRTHIPVEYFKTERAASATTSRGTAMAAATEMRIRAGQIRYEHTAKSIGAVKGGYFLRGGKPSTTAERGLVRTRPIGPDTLRLPAADTTLPRPTRVYAEITRPYTKAGREQLFGSPAEIAWLTKGRRKVSYGVRGGPKQPRVEITAEPWGYHPTYPHGIVGGAAAVTSRLTGYTTKRISTGMYFHPEGAPSSRVATVADILRPKTIGTRAPPKPMRPEPKPIVGEPEPMRAPKSTPVTPKRRVTFAEPTASPVLETIFSPKPASVPSRRRVTFAEPTTSPVVEAILKDAKMRREAVQTPRASTAPSRRSRTARYRRSRTARSRVAVPRTATEILAQQKMPEDIHGPEPATKAHRKPTPMRPDVAKPRTTPFTPRTAQVPDVSRIRQPVTVQTPQEEAQRRAQETITMTVFGTSTIPKMPEPETREIPTLPKDDMKPAIKKRRRKEEWEYWRIKNPIANLQQMMFGRVGSKKGSKKMDNLK